MHCHCCLAPAVLTILSSPPKFHYWLYTILLLFTTHFLHSLCINASVCFVLPHSDFQMLPDFQCLCIPRAYPVPKALYDTFYWQISLLHSLHILYGLLKVLPLIASLCEAKIFMNNPWHHFSSISVWVCELVAVRNSWPQIIAEFHFHKCMKLIRDLPPYCRFLKSSSEW